MSKRILVVEDQPDNRQIIRCESACKKDPLPAVHRRDNALAQVF
jgi:hypothetical protein